MDWNLSKACFDIVVVIIIDVVAANLSSSHVSTYLSVLTI